MASQNTDRISIQRLSRTDVEFNPYAITDSETPSSVDIIPNKPSRLPLFLPTDETNREDKRSLFNNFEAPKWKPIILHILFCIVAFPILKLCVVIAQDKSLFWTRFIVGVGCGVVGLGLSFTLLELGKPFLEAATWATVIHLSEVQNDPGIKLNDLAAASSDATSSFSALRLLWARTGSLRTERSARKAYDRRFWTAYILFFLLLTILAASISFALGRLVDITATLTHQTRDYEEVTISGVNSAADIERSKDPDAVSMFENATTFFFTWAPPTFSHHDRLPLVASLNYRDDKVYFAETTLSQLLPGGHGFGTFDKEFFNPSIAVEAPKIASVTRDELQPIDPGYMLRYQKWGTRMHCVKLPDPDRYLMPKDNDGFTVVFTPRQTLHELFASFDLKFNDTHFPPPPNDVNGTLPVGLDLADVAFTSFFADGGDSVYLHGYQYLFDENDVYGGWATIEQVIVRLNTTYTPNGKFARVDDWSVLDANGAATYIGYDSVTCVHLFEPWVVETYNGTVGAPKARRLIGPGVGLDLGESGIKERRFGPPVTDPTVVRQLEPSNITDVFGALFLNSMIHLVRDTQNSGFYTPSRTLLSFTDGVGPLGYTELSAERYAAYRGSALAMYLLPFFAGSGQLVARRYPDLVLASAFIHLYSTLGYLAGVLVVGLIAGLFVPKLPLDVRRRGFQLYSWIAMFRANELGFSEMPDIERNMDLEDIEKRFGDLRVRYIREKVLTQEKGSS